MRAQLSPCFQIGNRRIAVIILCSFATGWLRGYLSSTLVLGLTQITGRRDPIGGNATVNLNHTQSPRFDVLIQRPGFRIAWHNMMEM
ncbi:hypothetical protein BD410DRAFT_791616, partial [Rickenella mellea]